MSIWTLSPTVVGTTINSPPATTAWAGIAGAALRHALATRFGHRGRCHHKSYAHQGSQYRALHASPFEFIN